MVTGALGRASPTVGNDNANYAVPLMLMVSLYFGIGFILVRGRGSITLFAIGLPARPSISSRQRPAM